MLKHNRFVHTNNPGNRHPLAFTTSGIVWLVHDLETSVGVFNGRGILLPAVGDLALWKNIESIDHPQIAKVRLLSDQDGGGIWVQYEPNPLPLHKTSESILSTQQLVEYLSSEGVEQETIPAARLLKKRGHYPLLVCLAAELRGLQGWKPLGSVRSLDAEGSSKWQQDAVEDPLGANRGITFETESQVLTTTDVPNQQVEEPHPITRSLPRLRRPGYRYKALALVTVIALAGSGLGWFLRIGQVENECPEPEVINQVVADLLERRGKALSEGDSTELAEIESAEMVSTDLMMIEIAQSEGERILAPPYTVEIISFTKCSAKAINIEAKIGAEAFEDCDEQSCIKVDATTPRVMNVELSVDPWKLGSLSRGS